MNDYLKQSELSYFFSQHSMSNNTNVGKQVPSIYSRPKEDDSVFGGVWVQPEEEARKNALSITGTEIWGPRPQFASEKSWESKSGGSLSGRGSATAPESDSLNKWQQADWSRRSNMSSSSETSPPPINPHLHNSSPNILMPSFNRVPHLDNKHPLMWKNLQQVQQTMLQPLHFQHLQQQQLQQQQQVSQKQLLMQLLQQKKMQASVAGQQAASFDCPWLPPNIPPPSKKQLDPLTIDLYKKIACHLNPTQQCPPTRSKMIQQLVSMGFKREDVGRMLMENDLDYELTLGELVYKSSLPQGLNNNTHGLNNNTHGLNNNTHGLNNKNNINQGFNTKIMPQNLNHNISQGNNINLSSLQQQQFNQPPQQSLQQYLKSLVASMQQQPQQQQVKQAPMLLSMLNNLHNMPPFPSNQVPVDYTVQSLLSNQHKLPTSTSAFFQSANCTNNNVNPFFSNLRNKLNGGIEGAMHTTPLLNPQSPEWTPPTRDVTSLLSNISISSPPPKWSPPTEHQTSSTNEKQDDSLNVSSHYWLPHDLNTTVDEEEKTPASAWVAISHVPALVSKDMLALTLCSFGVLKSLNLENAYALACFQDKQQASLARTELNSVGLHGDTRVRVEFVPDWTLDAPSFKPLQPTEHHTDHHHRETGYTTPGGLWIPKREYFQFSDDDAAGVGGADGGVIKSSGGSGSGGSSGSGSGSGGSAVGGGSGEVDCGYGDGGRKTYMDDKTAAEAGRGDDDNLDFLFDEPYDGPLNKPS